MDYDIDSRYNRKISETLNRLLKDNRHITPIEFRIFMKHGQRAARMSDGVMIDMLMSSEDQLNAWRTGFETPAQDKCRAVLKTLSKQIKV